MKDLINKHFKLLLFIAIIINIVIVLIFKPACPWKVNFNIDCAGCGATRMIESIIKLDFYQAFRYNPLAFILLPLFICYYIIKYIFYLKNKQLIINNKVWYTILMIVILFGIIRNIPTFKYLIPTKI